MSTRYARQTGKTFPRFTPHNLPDVMDSLRRMRTAPRWSAAFQTHYLPHRERVMRPVLGQLRMIESAIRMDLAGRAALAAWRMAVAA